MKWFQRKVNKNVPIDENLIRGKAMEIALKWRQDRIVFVASSVMEENVAQREKLCCV